MILCDTSGSKVNKKVDSKLFNNSGNWLFKVEAFVFTLLQGIGDLN